MVVYNHHSLYKVIVNRHNTITFYFERDSTSDVYLLLYELTVFLNENCKRKIKLDLFVG